MTDWTKFDTLIVVAVIILIVFGVLGTGIR